MKKKVRNIIIAFIIIGFCIFTINICALNELQNLTNSRCNTSEIKISIKNYQSGHSIDVIDTTDIEEIYEGISEIHYSGLFFGNTRIDSDDQAYSLIISTEEAYAILIISASDKQSRVDGKYFSISIKNYDSLYQTVKAILN